MKMRFQKHTLRADSSSRRREMKTTLCTADDHCHLSSLQVSSSGSTCWFNRGKRAGWHSSSNHHRLTSCHHRNKQSSVQAYGYWSLPCGQKISAFQQMSHFSQLCGFTLSCLSEQVYGGSLQSPSITSICWWIATQCLLRSVWDKSPQFLQTAS